MNLSRHAEIRVAQRGIRKEVLALVMSEHDVDADVGNGCCALRVSRRRIRDLLEEGHPPKTVERLKRLVVVDGAAGTVVTIMHDSGTRGRRYRRGAR